MVADMNGVNVQIPFGSVSISQSHLEPVFIARGRSFDHEVFIGPSYMNGKIRQISFDEDEDFRNLSCQEQSEFEILVAKNVKNRELSKNRIKGFLKSNHYILAFNGSSNSVPNDAIFIGFDENNFKTYLGRAWFSNDLLPASYITIGSVCGIRHGRRTG